MAAPAPKPDLGALFGGKGPPEGSDEEEANESPDDEESESALDSAIDEMFDATDPMKRREAFKRACKLCTQSDY